jgi:ubiquinone/menaquinone biosynthesis C-methylase UbiE
MSFDLLAPYYRWMERVLAGAKVQRCRLANLKSIREPGKVLLLGEGNGRFLKELLVEYPQAQITCVEMSGGMIAQAKAALQDAQCETCRVEWVQANVIEWSGGRGVYDLAVTNFFLDCFSEEELGRVIERIGDALKPKGEWLIADFCVPPAGLKRWRAETILWLMYRFFRLSTGISASRLTAPDAALRKNGFQLQQQRTFEWGLLHSQLWQRG